ncbi:hypothetical protein AB7C35_03660 [Bacillus subtilis]|nr:hypothetical protein [Bacillus subtilis]MBW9315703.1 hypothetical protein [Bacillus subtilis]MCB7163222.1 hypothetical protein [Bacillus subtilis]MCB7461819.1 hypothetical protein [Bacillus subtilis]MEC2199945.1 hypothetical protein [Bacillus subtilis]MEC2335243.1 hypothetical protein [Bacillus subtilis]
MRKFYKSKYVIEYLESIEIEGKKVKKVYYENFSTREKYKEQVRSNLGKKEIEVSIGILEDSIHINKDTNIWHTSYFALYGVILTVFFTALNNFTSGRSMAQENFILVSVLFFIFLLFALFLLFRGIYFSNVSKSYGYKRILEECLTEIETAELEKTEKKAANRELEPKALNIR